MGVFSKRAGGGRESGSALRRVVFAAVLVLFAPSLFAEEAGRTAVNVVVLCGEAGTLRVDLIDEDSFGDPRKPLRREELVVGEADIPCSASIRFTDLAVGRYALRAFIDRNGDGKLNGGLFGPIECWALSWSDGPKRRVPRFEDIAFTAGPGLKEIRLNFTEGRKN